MGLINHKLAAGSDVDMGIDFDALDENKDMFGDQLYPNLDYDTTANNPELEYLKSPPVVLNSLQDRLAKKAKKASSQAEKNLKTPGIDRSVEERYPHLSPFSIISVVDKVIYRTRSERDQALSLRQELKLNEVKDTSSSQRFALKPDSTSQDSKPRGTPRSMVPQAILEIPQNQLLSAENLSRSTPKFSPKSPPQLMLDKMVRLEERVRRHYLGHASPGESPE